MPGRYQDLEDHLHSELSAYRNKSKRLQPGQELQVDYEGTDQHQKYEMDDRNDYSTD